MLYYAENRDLIGTILSKMICFAITAPDFDLSAI